MKTKPSPPAPKGRSRTRTYLAMGSIIVLVVGGYLGWTEWTVLDHYRNAVKAIEARNFPKAIEQLEVCKQAWPESGEIAFLLSRTARRNYDFVTAADELERAERLGWPADAIAFEQALMKTQQGQRRSTEYSLIEAIRKGGPDTLYIVEILGPAYAQSYSPGLAVEVLEKWIEIEPNNPAPYYWLGEVAKRAERAPDARDYYTQALERDPTYRNAAVRLARELFEVRAYAEALQLLEPFLARDPKDREVRLLVAHACCEPSQLARARSLLEPLCEEFPTDAEVMLERGRLELREEHYAEAEKWLRQAFEKNPFDPQVSFNLSRALAGQGKADDIKQSRDRFIQIEADQRIMEELARRITRDTRDIDARTEMGIILRRNQQFRASLDWLLTALEIDPRSSRVHREVAATFEKLGRPDKVQQHLNMANHFAKEK